MELVRLQKFMAEAGVGSRRGCEALIVDGRVLVNGVPATLGMRINPLQDTVLLDGAPLTRAKNRVVLLFYKPRGVVCTSKDPQGRRTVQDYFADVEERLFNVGRLDVNSEGLLIMTNDGALMQRLTHPRFKVKKTYYVVADGVLTGEEASRLMKGVELTDGMTAPAQVERIRPVGEGRTSFLITIREGRNRQVRRMLEAVGHKTLLLRREKIGGLRLQGLRPGEWRPASETEMQYLDTLLHSDKE